MTDIQTASTFINSLFTVKTRENGEKYTVFSDTMTEGIKDSLCDLNFDIQDYYYDFGREACTAIAEYLNENSEELDGKNLETILEDLEYCESGIEADIYTDDLIAWLASSTNYIKYVDEAVADGSCVTGTGMLEFAQEAMKAEIFEMIKKALLENCNQESFYDLAS